MIGLGVDIKPRRSFTIDRSKWLRGTTTVLLNDAGCGCAMGLYLLELGMAPEHLVDCATPSEIVVVCEVPLPVEASWCVTRNARFGLRFDSVPVMDITSFNDRRDIDERDREHEIARIFRDQGVDVTFVDSVAEASS